MRNELEEDQRRDWNDLVKNDMTISGLKWRDAIDKSESSWVHTAYPA